MTSNKEEFKAFCEKETSLPIFLSYEWLNLVAENQWDVALEKQGEEIVGVFPYILYKKYFFSFIQLPPLTSYGGPWIKYPQGQKYSSSLSYEKELFTKLINKLPDVDYFEQKFYPKLNNWLPFYWKGYNQTTFYTYVLKDISNKELLFENFRENVRREIRKAEKKISVAPSEDINILYELKLKAYKKAGLKINISKQKLEKIYTFCKERNCGELLIATLNNEIHSAALFVRDKESCYYLYGASDPAYKTSGGMTLLMWNAIQGNSTKVKEFNFEGSMIEDIERFFRGFGAEQVPYFVIRKTYSKLLKIKNFIKSI